MEELIGQSDSEENEANDAFDFMDQEKTVFLIEDGIDPVFTNIEYIENKDNKEKEEEQKVKMSKVLNVISRVKKFWRFKNECNLP